MKRIRFAAGQSFVFIRHAETGMPCSGLCGKGWLSVEAALRGSSKFWARISIYECQPERSATWLRHSDRELSQISVQATCP